MTAMPTVPPKLYEKLALRHDGCVILQPQCALHKAQLRSILRD
jgi:hypothetical protein